MNDFDRELRDRLGRLEAAAPEPAHPSSAMVRRHRSRRKAMTFVAIAAVLGLIVGSTFAVLGSAPPRSVAEQAIDDANAERLNVALADHWGDCMSEAEATALAQDRLNALGLDDWIIRPAGTSVQDAPCVGADAVAGQREVILSPSMGERVNAALEALKTDLLTRCLDQPQAIELLRSTLQSAGVEDPLIAAGGIQGVPGSGPDSEESRAYVRHVADGCVVFGRAQPNQQGRYTWSLASR